MFHFICVNKDMICQAILELQSKAVQEGVVRVPDSRIYVVQGEDDFFSCQFVKEGEERSVKVLELVIPQNMKDFRLGNHCVRDQLYVIADQPEQFCREFIIPTLPATQIEKVEFRGFMELGAIQVLASDEVQPNSFRQ
jgi:hypothetical protein